MHITNILGDGVGSLELIQQVGDDKMVVNAARVSYRNDDTLKHILTFSDKRLIRYLVKHKHTSPFEHNLLTVKVKVPMFVGEQWLRHRIGWSYNKESGRYIEMGEPEFYLPANFRRQSENNRQASTDEHVDFDLGQLITHYRNSVQLYKGMLYKGVAREQARIVLPQALYMSMFATCNLASLMHFVRLRDSDDAQWETRQYAIALKEVAREFWPDSMRALEEVK